jgi:large subunit ribosomal protein L25
MEFTIKAEPREVTKKKVKQLRNQGLVPAAIYGFNGNVNVQFVEKEFAKVLSKAGHTSVVELDLGGKNHNVIIDEVQINPVTREIKHVSLREVNMKVEITADVPFEIQGEELSPAVKEQSSLIILSTPSVEVRGLPKSIPHAITIDVSALAAGDTITLKDIKLPEGLELVRAEDIDMTVVTTTSALQEEVEINVNEAMAEATAEPAATEEKVEEK